MNYVILSPHFPTNYFQFYVHLSALGANVLGVADEPYDNLRNELKSALSDYYYVPNMHNYDDLLRAMGYLTYRWGKIDGLDSHSEYWMETEAKLRTDFNIEGMNLVDLPAIKRKSLMKKMYTKAGVESAPGIVVRSVASARRFGREMGFPLIAKPDIGVGAANTYRFDNQEQLETFLSTLPQMNYFLEKFIEGRLVTFDGLTDQNGDIVFCSSMEFSSGILEAVNEDTDLFYYTLREIPSDLEEAGRKVVRAYNIRKRFFHLEFFRTEGGKLYGLEVNMRPPGGLTTDMFNYANDFDIYYEWANIIVFNRFSANYSRPYFCAYIGRKRNMHYLHSHKEILGQIGKQLVQYEEISVIFAKVFGNYGYVVRSTKLDEIHAMVNFIQEKVAPTKD